MWQQPLFQTHDVHMRVFQPFATMHGNQGDSFALLVFFIQPVLIQGNFLKELIQAIFPLHGAHGGGQAVDR